MKPSRTSFALLALLCLFLHGCGSVTLRGTYICDHAALNQNAAIYLGDQASVYMGVTYDPQQQRIVSGTPLWQQATYSLTGSTVRIEGGVPTDYEKALELLSSKSSSENGNVSLFHVADDGQALEFTADDGTVMRFIKQ